jgi:hypothetical protein
MYAVRENSNFSEQRLLKTSLSSGTTLSAKTSEVRAANRAHTFCIMLILFRYLRTPEEELIAFDYEIKLF